MATEIKKVEDIIAGKQMKLICSPGKGMWLWMGTDSPDVEKKTRLNYNLFAPLNKGQMVGELDLYVNSRYYSSIKILTSQEVARQSWIGTRIIESLWSLIKNEFPGETES